MPKTDHTKFLAPLTTLILVALGCVCGPTFAQTPVSSSPPAAATPVATVATTQQTNVPTFNLQQTIQAALASSTALAIANKTLERDAAAIDASASQARPQLGASGIYTHLDSPIKIAFGAQTIVVQPDNTQTITGQATLPIDITGAIRETTDASRLQYLADRFDRDSVFNNRVLFAQTSYFTLLRAEHQVDVAQSALQNAQTQETIAQQQFQGGVGQRIDYLRAQTQVATAQQNLLAAKNSLQNEQNAFNDLLGRPLNAPVEAVDAAGVSTGLAVEVNANDMSSVDAGTGTLYVPALSPTVSLDNGLQIAQQTRPELLADEVIKQADEKQIQIARTALYPKLSLSAVGDYYPVTDFQAPRHSLGIFSATLTIPLYDGGLTRDRVKEARATAQSAALLLGSDKTDVELAVRQAYTNLITAAQDISAANSALQEAVAARRLAQIRYANGVGLYLEVTDAESALTQAETQQVNAVYDYLTARAQYDNAIGKPNLQPQL